MGFMARKSNSKARMVETMRVLLQKQGYNGTGMNQVVKESGSPKGSMYFHFPGGKEELAVAAIHQASEEIQTRFGAIMSSGKGPGAMIEAVCDVLIAELKESNFEKGCPAATVALEASAYSEQLQQACVDLYDVYISTLTALFEETLGNSDAAKSGAFFVLSSIEGALLLAKTYKSEDPLKSVGAHLKHWCDQQFTPE